LEEIISYYNKKGNVPTHYKVARKRAFLEMSNLSAAFQRMTQEPKSKQKNLDKFYEMAMLNHTFLSSLASLSTYILNNPTTPASANFNKVSAKIVQNLLMAELVLKDDIPAERIKTETQNEDSEAIFEAVFGTKISFPETEKPKPEAFNLLVEEAHLVREQLKWLLAMSEKIPKLLKEINF
jgi:uncharacterized membrane protein YccC